MPFYWDVTPHFYAQKIRKTTCFKMTLRLYFSFNYDETWTTFVFQCIYNLTGFILNFVKSGSEI